MERTVERYETGKNRRHNPEYQKLVHLRKKAKTMRERKMYLNLLRKVPHGDPMDPNFKRMMYVRYADDFIILITGSKDEAQMIKHQVKAALKSLCGAELNDQKTIITNMQESFFFLGAEIRKLNRGTEYTGYGGKNTGNRVITRRLVINAPVNKLLKDMEKANMVRRNQGGKIIPKSCTSLTNLTHYDIINFYNYKIMGILNFFSFASNYSKLGSVI